MLRRTRKLAASLALTALVFSGVSLADQILEVYSASLTTYKASGKTLVQGVQPRPEQRGVGIDGVARASAAQPMAFAGNPFELARVGGRMLGDIDLAVGVYSPTDVDMALPAPGFSWVIQRTYNSRQDDSGFFASNGAGGFNWHIGSQPELQFYDDVGSAANDVIYLVYGADRYLEFVRKDSGSTEFKGRNGAAGAITVGDYTSPQPDTYIYVDPHGNELEFFDFQTDSGVAKGQLWRITDPAGNVAYVGDATTGTTAISAGFDANGRMKLAYDTADRRYTYSYSSSDIGGVKRLESVVAQTKSSGTWASPSGLSEVGRVEYGYYTSDGADDGDAGDLRYVTVTTPLSDADVDDVRTKHYRYWDQTYNADSSPGHAHEVRLVLDFEGARRFDLAEGDEGEPVLDGGYLSANISALEAYASMKFEYTSGRQIRAATFNGNCGCSGGDGSGLHTIAYHDVPSFSGTGGYDSGASRRVVVGRPDGSYLTQYFDECGQALSQVITHVAPTSTSPSPVRWVTSVQRDSRGGVETIGTPASVDSYTHNDGSGDALGTIALKTGDGLIWRFVRESTGDFTGFATAKKYAKGSSASGFYLMSQVFEDVDLSFGDVSIVRPLIDKQRSFATEQTTETGYDETAYAYTAWSGEPLTIETVTVTPPEVSTGTNGSGTTTGTATSSHHRKDGLVDFSKDADGIIQYQEYSNGRMTKRIADADTYQASSGQDFFGVTVPSGFESTGDELHEKTTRTYDAQGRVVLTTLPTGRVTREHYSHLLDGRLVELVYPRYVAGSGTFYGPASVRITNHAGRPEEQGHVVIAAAGSTMAVDEHCDTAESDPIAAIDVGTLTHWSAVEYDTTGTREQSSRSYHTMPSSLPGTVSTHFDQTTSAYDSMGRTIRSVTADGTIHRTNYDAMGRMTASSIGTDDTGLPGSTSSGTSNMVTVEERFYDDVSTAGGNSNLATRWQYVEASSTGRRDTAYTYDVRGNVLLVDNPAGPDSLTKYDARGRAIAVGLYSSTSATNDPTSTTTNRLALSQTFFDARGREWKSQRHKIDVADGSDDDNLQTLTWYDVDGRMVKQDGEQLAKTAYDRLGRTLVQYILASDDDSTYADVDDVFGDVVLEQHQTAYDSGGRAIVQASISRYHTDLATPTGSLDTGLGTPDAFTLTGSPDVLGRIQIEATSYDSLDRVANTAQYGTHSGSNFSYAGASFTPSGSVLVTSRVYNDDGTLLSVADPKAIVTRYEYDAAQRRTKVIANYVNGSPSSATADDDQVVEYAYTNGLQTSITAKLSGGGDQVTRYFYGTRSGTPSAMKIATGNLLRAVKYPDSANFETDVDGIEDTDSTDVVLFAYNAQGQQTWKKDQYVTTPSAAGGNIIETTYDAAGRETARAVTTPGTGFDAAVLRIETAYTALGQVQTVTQFDSASGGDELDQVKYVYDGWGNVEKFQQDVDDTVGGTADHEVVYAYDKATTGRNTIRRTSETIGGKTFTLSYVSLGGSGDGSYSRVTSIKDGATTLVKYDYLGADHVVGTTYDEPDVFSKQYSSTAGAYPDLDRFNRVVVSKWTKDLSTDVDFYSNTLTYDANSNIASNDDAVHAGVDVKYGMDNLNRLIDADEGTLSSGSITSRTRRQEWDLSQTGNWLEDKLDLNGDGDGGDADEWVDQKTFNAVNEILTRDLDSNSGTTGNNHALVYDLAGNLTSDPSADRKYEWDAFYRLRKVKTQAGALVAEYRYNGLGHRIAVLADTDLDSDVDGSDLWYYSSFDERWRMVATYRSTDANPKERFVHHQAGAGGDGGSSYIDLVAFREKDTDEAWTDASDGTYEERLYYCQNQHADVVALVTNAGAQREMVRYSAYGVPFGLPVGDCDSDGDAMIDDRSQIQTWINASSYDVRGDLDLDGDVDSTDKNALRDYFENVTLGRKVLSAEAVGNARGCAGSETGGPAALPLTSVRLRQFDPGVGMWISRDALGAAGVFEGDYEFVGSQPVASRDPYGLVASTCVPDPASSSVSPGALGRTMVITVGSSTIEVGFTVTAECESAFGLGNCNNGLCGWKCLMRFRFVYRVNGGEWEKVEDMKRGTEYSAVFVAVHGASPDEKDPKKEWPEWSGPGGYTGHDSSHKVNVWLRSRCPDTTTLEWTAATPSGSVLSATKDFYCNCRTGESSNESGGSWMPPLEW